MKVKICGITRVEDAILAVELGADAVGFVMAESPRQIGTEQASKISSQLPEKILRFGVFVNPEINRIAMALDAGAINAIQLHGSESHDYVREIRRKFPSLFLLKAISPDALSTADTYSSDALLIDPPRGNRPKDTDEFLMSLRGKLPECPTWIAGGISKQNLARIEKLKPAGIDLSSSVESSPGIKDPKLLREFFAALQGVRS